MVEEQGIQKAYTKKNDWKNYGGFHKRGSLFYGETVQNWSQNTSFIA